MHHSGAARRVGKRLDGDCGSLGSPGLMRMHWGLLVPARCWWQCRGGEDLRSRFSRSFFGGLFAQRLAFEREAMTAVHDAIEDGVG